MIEMTILDGATTCLLWCPSPACRRPRPGEFRSWDEHVVSFGMDYDGLCILVYNYVNKNMYDDVYLCITI